MSQPSTSRSEGDASLEPVISLEGVRVRFGGRDVLESLDLQVAKGEFVAIIGPSGGGKSTLLRLIAGLLEAQEGSVRVSGRPAMVFQDYRLLPWRTVWQNVNLPRELTGRGGDPDEELKQVGMGAYASLYPHQLSGGMRARVAIARALAQDGEVILFDEPFAALDALVRERFNLEMKRLHHKTGKTILFVTHSIREAVYLADRVVVLRDGRIETILDTRGEGRLTAFTDGLEAELRSRLGMPDSTFVEPPPAPLRPPWEVFGAVGLLTLFLAAWGFFASSQNSLFFPGPAKVLAAFSANAPSLLQSALATLEVTLLGLACSLVIGSAIGWLMGKARVLERLLSPLIVALQAVPTVILAPLLVYQLGYGLESRVAVTVLISLFPIMVSTMVGVREVDRVYREVFSTIGANWWGLFGKLELPGALPVWLGGLRLTVTLALIGTVVGEFALGKPSGGVGGLGYVVATEQRNVRLDLAYAAVLLNILLGCALYALVAGLERFMLQYRRR